ncbi:unnamed protein product [Sphagnum troendelagicum]|uniref:Peroxidase n=1 Tax=Sphagnum troendelagicum TaxID=128251 RepID=A0ABP0U389_9BRYO
MKETASFCKSYLLWFFSLSAILYAYSVGFYNGNNSCSGAEAIVNEVVTKAVKADPSIAAALLRMVYHDCFVRGCDASILLDPSLSNPEPEKNALINLSIRGYEVIDTAKAALERLCPGIVSCADIIALAARDAVGLSGGMAFDMPTGRLDGMISSVQDVSDNLPGTTLSAKEMTQQFAQHGLTQDEMVTLAGAHTIGQAHCDQFTNRLYNFPGSPTGIDPTFHPTYAQHLKSICAVETDSDILVPLDPLSPNVFDNNYFMNGVLGMVLFSSDISLFYDVQTQAMSHLNAQHEELWETKFAKALVHLASLQLIEPGEPGEIRTNCRSRNHEL